MMISSVKYEPINLPLPRQQQNWTLKAAERKRPVTIITKNKIKRKRDVEEVKPADVYNAKRIRTEHSSTLNFTSYYYKSDSKFRSFDKFVYQSLSNRDPVNLDRLTFTRCGVSSCAKILEKVFSYALSHNVKQLESWIKNSTNGSWPNCLKNSSNSLTSLKLQSDNIVSCPLFESQSGAFKNLAILNLSSTIISYSQPFSRFPNLEKLTLIHCRIEDEGNTLNIHALKLLELEISCYEWIDHVELVTPNLKLFQFCARNFPKLNALHGLPVLQTVAINYRDVGVHKHEKKTFEDLLCLFSKVYNTKSLRIFPAVIELLTLFKDELLCSPFVDLEFLKLDYSRTYWKLSNEPCAEILNYLLKNCNDVKYSIVFSKRFACANCKPLCECVQEVVVC